MESDGGGVMLAELAIKWADSLHFKMIGEGSDDPALEFGRGRTNQEIRLGAGTRFRGTVTSRTTTIHKGENSCRN